MSHPASKEVDGVSEGDIPGFHLSSTCAYTQVYTGTHMYADTYLFPTPLEPGSYRGKSCTKCFCRPPQTACLLVFPQVCVLDVRSGTVCWEVSDHRVVLPRGTAEPCVPLAPYLAMWSLPVALPCTPGGPYRSQADARTGLLNLWNSGLSKLPFSTELLTSGILL